eukprot:s2052_g1.t1
MIDEACNKDKFVIFLDLSLAIDTLHCLGSGLVFNHGPELDYHDLLGLFEMLDDGDGEISMKEFIENAQKLKGPAKAIDMHRLETKLELLLAQVLANTSSTAAGRSHRSSTYSLQTLFSAAGLSRESHGFASRMAAAAAATLGDDDKSATAKNVKRSASRETDLGPQLSHRF